LGVAHDMSVKFRLWTLH